MEYRIRAYSIWHPGKRVDADGNPHQEDSMSPGHGTMTERDRLFILCDGMGGHEAGEVASATVCEAMASFIRSAAPDPEGHFTDGMLQGAISAAFDALDAKDDGTATRKMGTTMTLLKLHDGGCHIAHMGDSRVYHIRPGKTAADTRILFRTEDHSLVNDLVRIGELTPEEARVSNRRNVITRAMQPHMERRPRADVHHAVDIAPGDYFYLCTDGMLENMEDRQLRYHFSEEGGDDARKVDSLLKATKENSDNHSAIIVHVLDVLNPIPIPCGPAREAVPDSGPLVGELHEDGIQAEGEMHGPQASTPKGMLGRQMFGKVLGAVIALALVLALLALFLRGNDAGSGERSGPAPRDWKRIDKPSKANTGSRKVRVPATVPMAAPVSRNPEAVPPEAGDGAGESHEATRQDGAASGTGVKDPSDGGAKGKADVTESPESSASSGNERDNMQSVGNATAE